MGIRNKNGRTMIGELWVVAMVLLTATAFAAPGTDEAKDGWISLFDGKTLNGWKAGENADLWKVENGMIVAPGKRSHLFYDGPVQNHNFKNFELKVDVMTTTGSNSGVYFHSEFQTVGYPNKGHEAQVNSSHSDPKRTGSLYGVNDYVVKDPVKETDKLLSHDGMWFTYHIIVKGKQIVFRVDGKTIVDYTEPANVVIPKGRPGRQLSSGTFALQAHPPARPTDKGINYFRNILVKPLPE